MRLAVPALATLCLAASAFAVGPDASTPAVADPPVRPLIVVDAGHGGANSGAPSAVSGINEKHFTLAVSIRLAEKLRARGAEVIMTRTSDAYLTLRERSDIANRAGADLFVSVHGNASPDHSRSGFETYFLSPSALDVDGRALRTLGPDRPGVSAPISRLLDDVERGIAHPLSADLATAVQKRLAETRPASPDRGVKQESMHVLLGANMPAVLVELGFIDHPVEGLELLDPAVQDELAAAVADALIPTLP